MSTFVRYMYVASTHHVTSHQLVMTFGGVGHGPKDVLGIFATSPLSMASSMPVVDRRKFLAADDADVW